MKNYCRWCHQADDFTPPILVNKPLRPPESCPECGREIILIGIPLAAKIMQRGKIAIYEWVEGGLASGVKRPGKRWLVCYSSLFRPPDDEECNGSPAN